MELLKKFTCLVACFVVLSSSFMVGYAVEETEDYFNGNITHQDFIDMGYSYDPYDDTYYIEKGFSFPSLFASSYIGYQLYDDFDPSYDIPWLETPQYVQDIIYNLDVDFSYQEYPKVPFVFINYDGVRVWVLVGINLGLGLSLETSSLRVCGVTSTGNAAVNRNQCAYYAIYKPDSTGKFVISQDWTARTPSAWSDSGRIVSYSSGILGGTIYDNYLYGGTCVKSSADTFYSTVVYNGSVTSATDTNAFPIEFVQNREGFASGKFYSTNAPSTSIYISYFKPFTREDYSEKLQEEQNGFLEDILGEFQSSGESDLTTLPGEALDDYNQAESELVDDYNPDDLEDDLDIDFDNSALDYVWDLVDNFITADNTVFTLFVSILSLGIIALILGR